MERSIHRYRALQILKSDKFAKGLEESTARNGLKSLF